MHALFSSSSALGSSATPSSSFSARISRPNRLIYNGDLCNDSRCPTGATRLKSNNGSFYLSLSLSKPDRSRTSTSELRNGKSDGQFQSVKVKATFENVEGRFGEVEEETKEDQIEIVRTVKMGLMFTVWYLFNIYFNIYNKQILKVYPFPITITAVQFGIGSVLILLMWATNLHKRPKFSISQLKVIVPLAILHTMGNLFTNMSLLKVAVSFTHTVKAMEPFFSVLLSALFLNERPSGLVLGTLLPVVGGVALASFTEASFNWVGFWSAMASNVTNQSRNVISKKLMTNKDESLDNINLFSIITVVSFVLSAIVLFLTDGIVFTPSYLQASGLDVREIYTRCLLAGLCFHAYQQAGYMLLAYVSPVTHSVGNCVKRVVVIVSSVLFFRTPISPINSLGTGIALAGVFLYSRVKKIKPKFE